MPTFDQQLTLHTNRLLIRPLQADDADALFAIHADAEFMQYWSEPPWQEIATAHERIVRYQTALADGQYLRLGLAPKDGGPLLGTVTLFNFDDQCRRADIGYGLARPAWGQGLMHEALRELVRYAFEDLALNRLEADIHPDNLASAKTLDRLGFTREGYLRERWIVDGHVSDSAIYGLLHREWLANSR